MSQIGNRRLAAADRANPSFRRFLVEQALYEGRFLARLGTTGHEVSLAGQAEAAWGGGARVIAVEHQRSLDTAALQDTASISPNLYVGVGGVPDAQWAELYLEAGADFVSGPPNLEVVDLCRRLGTLYLPEVSSREQLRNAADTGSAIIVLDGTGAKSDDLLAEARCSLPGRVLFVRPDSCGSEADVEHCIAAGAAGVVADIASAAKEAALDSLPVVTWIRRVLGEPLFGPIEHVGLYPPLSSTDSAVARWYQDVFGYPAVTAKTTYVGAGVAGRIEVMPAPADELPHLAVSVRDFDEAVRMLNSAGHPTRPPVITANAKLAYLAERDPSGCLVHIIWRPRGLAC